MLFKVFVVYFTLGGWRGLVRQVLGFEDILQHFYFYNTEICIANSPVDSTVQTPTYEMVLFWSLHFPGTTGPFQFLHFCFNPFQQLVSHHEWLLDQHSLLFSILKSGVWCFKSWILNTEQTNIKRCKESPFFFYSFSTPWVWSFTIPSEGSEKTIPMAWA